MVEDIIFPEIETVYRNFLQGRPNGIPLYLLKIIFTIF